MLPLAVFAAILMYFLWQSQEEERAKSQIEIARTLSSAVDNALESSIKRLEFLATLPVNERISTSYVYARARQALNLSPDWTDVALIAADGEQIFSLAVPFGSELPRVRIEGHLADALANSRAAVSDLFLAREEPRPVVEIAVPVARGGKTTHVLTARLNLAWFDGLLTRQGLPPGGIAGIFDRNLHFVARSHAGSERRGTDPSPGLLARMQASPEGIGRFASLDGDAVYTSWTTLPSGWHVALATAAHPIERALMRYLLFLGACSILAIGGGLIFATLLGNRISDSLSFAAQRASDLTLGKPLPPAPPSPVRELNVVGRALDETGQRLERAQRERDTLLAQEREARAAAEAANKAKDEFLAMLGHELRNPLGAISNAIGVIRDKRHTEGQLEYASNVISRQTEHLKRLIDDLLDVGRVMTGKIVLEKREIDLAESVQHVLTALTAAGKTDDHEIKVDASPAWVVADATRIEQVISNLIVNAVSYTPAGGSIRLTAGRDGDDAVFQIDDTGMGIASEILPNLFDLFFQGEQAIDRPNSGLGIGLTLVRKIVELHGGTVTAASAGRGKGSTFTVRLPAIPTPPTAVTQAARVQPRAQRTVIIVEDNADSRASLRMALELEGNRVYEAADGPQGLQQIRATQPHVAIVDIGLPGMDGYEVVRAIRSEHGRRVFVIALTGYGMPEDRARAQDAGFDMHLTKPVDLGQLAAVLDELRDPSR